MIMTAEFKTPMPIPVFYDSSCSFSTKKERSAPRYSKPKLKPALRVAPFNSRLFTDRWIARKPQQVSFKRLPSRDSGDLSSLCYDESLDESYFDQCFIVESKIGEGSFGEVFKVRSREDGGHYAVKRTFGAFRGATHKMEKLKEVRTHEQLPRHPNLVRFVKAWEERGFLYIQTELCRTNLSSLSENYHELPEAVVWNYLVDLLMAVQHLHDNDLIHLDIKPENIFIDYKGILKLGDFGLVTESSNIDVMEGDARYLAKEVLDGEGGKHSDIFSLGITILEIACDLDLPNHGEIWHSLREGELPDHLMTHLSIELRDVITRMMDPVYTLRPKAYELLNIYPVRSLAEQRLLTIAFRSLLTMARTVRLLFFALGCLSSGDGRWPWFNVVGGRPASVASLLLHRTAAFAFSSSRGRGGASATTTESRAKRKSRVANASYCSGIKRKLTAIDSSSERDDDDDELGGDDSGDRSMSPVLMARLSFSDEDASAAFDENDLLHNLSAIQKPDELSIDASFDQGCLDDAQSSKVTDDDDGVKIDDDSSSSILFSSPHNRSMPYKALKSGSRQWNSTPAHDKLKRRLPLIDAELNEMSPSSPLAKIGFNNKHSQKKLPVVDRLLNGEEPASDDVDWTAVRNDQPINGHLTPRDDDSSRIARLGRVKTPAKSAALTPRNLFKEFQDESFD